MPLAAHCVQSIGDLFLVRVFRQADEDAFTADGKDDLNIPIEQLEGNDFPSTSTSATSSSSNSSSRSCCWRSTLERTPSRIVSSWVETSSRALQEQWPRQEREEASSLQSEQPCKEKRTDHNDDHNDDDRDCNNADVVDCNASYDYYRKMIVHHEQSSPRYSLACSYLLVQHKHNIEGTTATTLLGHGRLAECYETAGGNAAAATYILIDPEWRGKGLGKSLLRLLELEANAKERLGCHYHFVYLWCKIATAPFYEQSGYSRCRNRVSLQRPCLKALAATSVQSLEEILRSRQQRQQQAAPVSEGKGNRSTKTGNSKKKVETVVLLPSSSSSSPKEEEQQTPEAEKDVWLRKRLVDHVESIQISQKDRTKEMNEFVVSTTNSWSVASSNTKGRTRSPHYYYRWNPRVPWQMQIGPSCGLTAIRMVKDFYYSCRASSQGEREQEQKEHLVSDRLSLSLLGDAQKRGYTQDGEIFDANHLRELMEDQLLFGRAANSNFSLDNISNCNGNDNAGSIDSMSSLSVRTRETSSFTAEEIYSTLRQGGLWILPYDSNPRTKLPDKMYGKRAHWGIIVGIVFAVGTTPSGDGDDDHDHNNDNNSNTNTTIGDTTRTQFAGPTKGDRLAVFDDEILSTRNNTQENESSAGREFDYSNDFASPLLIPLENGIESTNDDSASSAEKPMRSPQKNFDPEQLEHGTSTSIGCTGTSSRNVYWIVQHSLSSKWAIAPMDEWIDSNKQLVSVDHKFKLENEGTLNLKNRIIQVLPVRNDAMQPPRI